MTLKHRLLSLFSGNKNTEKYRKTIYKIYKTVKCSIFSIGRIRYKMHGLEKKSNKKVQPPVFLGGLHIHHIRCCFQKWKSSTQLRFSSAIIPVHLTSVPYRQKQKQFLKKTSRKYVLWIEKRHVYPSLVRSSVNMDLLIWELILKLTRLVWEVLIFKYRSAQH